MTVVSGKRPQVGALAEVDQESVVFEQQCEGYERWEDSCLIKFNEFLGNSTVGYENKILDLLRKWVCLSSQKRRVRGI